jgi:hypothetical protein
VIIKQEEATRGPDEEDADCESRNEDNQIVPLIMKFSFVYHITLVRKPISTMSMVFVVEGERSRAWS